MKSGPIFPKFKGFTALVLALLRVLILLLELWIPSNLHSSAILRRNEGWAHLPKVQGIHSSSISTRGVLILLLELWIPSNLHSSALLRRNEGWAHLPKVQGIRSSSISTPQSANTITRAVNPFKPPLLSPPQKEWRVGPSSQSSRDSQL